MPNSTAVTSAVSGAGASSLTTTILMIVAFIAIFYFLIIRPQSKQKKARTDMMKNLTVGARVKTIGQMYGRVAEIKDNYITIETGRDKVRLVFDRSAISTIEGGSEDTNADLQ